MKLPLRRGCHVKRASFSFRCLGERRCRERWPSRVGRVKQSRRGGNGGVYFALQDDHYQVVRSRSGGRGERVQSHVVLSKRRHPSEESWLREDCAPNCCAVFVAPRALGRRDLRSGLLSCDDAVR